MLETENKFLKIRLYDSVSFEGGEKNVDDPKTDEEKGGQVFSDLRTAQFRETARSGGSSQHQNADPYHSQA